MVKYRFLHFLEAFKVVCSEFFPLFEFNKDIYFSEHNVLCTNRVFYVFEINTLNENQQKVIPYKFSLFRVLMV